MFTTGMVLVTALLFFMIGMALGRASRVKKRPDAAMPQLQEVERRREIPGQLPLWVEEQLDQMPFDDDERP